MNDWASELTGAQCALIAWGFFRNRHGGKPRFKRSKRRSGDRVSCYRDNVQMARLYIRRARAAGWRGTIPQAAQEWKAR